MLDAEIVFVTVAGFLGVAGFILGALPRRPRSGVGQRRTDRPD